MTLDEATVVLLGDLLAVVGATGTASMPAGRRQAVIDLLTRLVVNPEAMDAYCRAIEAERTRLGSDGKRRLLNSSKADIPWELIRERGFADLSDDTLADLATSPEALAVLDASQFRGRADIGEWFFDAMLGDVRNRPGNAT